MAVSWLNLLEVYSVSVFLDEIDDVTCAEIDGKVLAYDRAQKPIYLYKPIEGSPSFLPDGKLALSGPFHCLKGDEWAFVLHLKDKRRDLKICNFNCIVGWALLESNKYGNRPLSVVGKAEGGYAVMNFMLHRHAVQATVEVSLQRRKNGQGIPSAVAGFIRARNDSYDFNEATQEKDFWISLFYASEEKPEKLQVGTKELPLLRSTVAVPLGYSLILKAKLSDGTSKFESFTASFKARLEGHMLKIGDGLQVKVTWDSDPPSTSLHQN